MIGMNDQEIKVEHHISPTGSLYYTASYSPSPNYCGFGMTPEEAVSDLQRYRESRELLGIEMPSSSRKLLTK